MRCTLAAFLTGVAALSGAQSVMRVDWSRQLPGYQFLSYKAAGKYVHTVSRVSNYGQDATYVRYSAAGVPSNQFTHTGGYFFTDMFVHFADPSGGAVYSFSQDYENLGSNYRYFRGGYIGDDGSRGVVPNPRLESPATFAESVVVGSKVRVAMGAQYFPDFASISTFPLVRGYDPASNISPLEVIGGGDSYRPIAMNYTHTGNLALVYYDESAGGYWLDQCNISHQLLSHLPLSSQNVPNDICAYPVSSAQNKGAQYVVIAGNGFVRKLNPTGTVAWTRSTPEYNYSKIEWVPNIGLVARRDGTINGKTVREVVFFTEQNITRKVTLLADAPTNFEFRVDSAGQIFVWYEIADTNGAYFLHSYPRPGVRHSYITQGPPAIDDFNNVYYASGGANLVAHLNLEPLAYQSITLKGGGSTRIYLNLRFGATREYRKVSVTSSGSANILVPTEAEFAPGGTTTSLKIPTRTVQAPEDRMVEIEFGGRKMPVRVTAVR